MPNLNIELDDGDMAALDATAHGQHVSPKEIAREAIETQRTSQESAKCVSQLEIIERGDDVDDLRRIQTVEAVGTDAKSRSGVHQSGDGVSDRAVRHAALMKMRDLWNDDGAEPFDGVEYQNAMRAEWR